MTTPPHTQEIAQAVVGHLSSGAAGALVGGRVYFTLAPEGDADDSTSTDAESDLPEIIVHRIPGTRATDMTGDSGLAESVVQIDCWGVEVEEAWTVWAAVLQALQGFKGDMQGPLGTVEVLSCLHQTEARPVYDDKKRAHGIQGDFQIAHCGL